MRKHSVHFGQGVLSLPFLSIHPIQNLSGPVTQKVYLIAVSYFQGRSILHGTCALSGYFEHLTISHENMTFTLQICLGQNLNGNCFIFQGISSCHRTCALQGYVDLLTFDLDIMTIALKIMSSSLLGNYK